MGSRSHRVLPFLLVAVLLASTLVSQEETSRLLNTVVVTTQQQQQQPKQTTRKPLPPVHVNSSWIGNQWIPPPGYKLYSGREIQAFFSRYSILFIGDSTARQSYGTLYGILNATKNPQDVQVKAINHPSVIDVNRRNITEFCHKEGMLLCRNNPLNASKSIDLTRMDEPKCLKGMATLVNNASSYFWTELNNYDLVVISIGPWEMIDRCGTVVEAQKHMDTLLNTMFQQERLRQNITFVWRTWGYHYPYRKGEDASKLRDKAEMYNYYVKTRMDRHDEEMRNATSHSSRVTDVDWASVMEPRLGPDTRIHGDIYEHYGLEARLAFLQMLMNHLVGREWQ